MGTIPLPRSEEKKRREGGREGLGHRGRGVVVLEDIRNQLVGEFGRFEMPKEAARKVGVHGYAERSSPRDRCCIWRTGNGLVAAGRGVSTDHGKDAVMGNQCRALGSSVCSLGHMVLVRPSQIT